MGRALSVFRLAPRAGHNLVRDLTTVKQLSFFDQEVSHGLPTPRSDLDLIRHDKDAGRAYYRARHHSKTIDQTIRVMARELIQGIEDGNVEVEPVDIIKTPYKNAATAVRSAYQELHKFDVAIDFGLSEVYVFAKNETALAFMRRFRTSDRLDFAHIYFDLSRIEDVPELENVFGAWMSGYGNVSKQAFFGTEVHKEEGVDVKKVTSYNVIVAAGESTIDFFIGHDCRLSTKLENVTNADLLDWWEKLKKNLGVFPSPKQIA